MTQKKTFARNLHIINKDAKNAIESFMMVSDCKKQTIVSTVTNADATNNVELTLTRLTAKVQMKWAVTAFADNFQPGSFNGAPLANCSFDTGKFHVMNVQTKMHPVNPGLDIVTKKYGSVLGWEKEEPGLIQLNNSWVDVIDNDNGFAYGEPTGYATENLMFEDAPLKKDATCLLVKTKLNIPANNANNGSFWAVARFNTTEIKEQVYRNLIQFESLHSTSQAASDYIKELKITEDEKKFYGVVEFLDGVVYYRVDLLDWIKGTNQSLKEIASIQRNRFYQVAINNILALGWPYPEEVIDPNDTRPIEDPALNIEATIKIADWVQVSQDADLK